MQEEYELLVLDEIKDCTGEEGENYVAFQKAKLNKIKKMDYD